MEALILILSIYLLGILISLLVLHRYAHVLGFDIYDPPHPDYYDDYDSNASAYVTFSIFWFFFWSFNLVFYIISLLLKLSEYIGTKVNQKLDK